MNLFLTDDWLERVDRLALGLEPVDAGRGTRIAHPIQVLFNDEARGLTRPKVDRHDSCLHALLYQPGVTGRIPLRFIEANRRFVPRLISYPILPIPQAEALSHRNRARRPVLFPGAAYDVTSGTTGIRGRVLRGGQPVRWARVVATMPITGFVAGRAHGDDRGEFLLLISPAAGPVGDLEEPLTVRVDVFGPAVPPVPNPVDLPSLDPLWDLPEEAAAALDPNDPALDPVSAAEVLPGGYTSTAGRDVDLSLGRIRSETTAFTIS